MREREMRARVFQFLKARMRGMLMPATVGIGLAASGACTVTTSTPLYGAPVKEDAALRQDLGQRDVAIDRPEASPVYSAPADVAGQEAVRHDGPLGYGPEVVPLYGSPVDAPSQDGRDGPEAAVDVGGRDGVAIDGAPAIPDGGAMTKYGVPLPDAALDSTPAMRYLAQMPDAARDGMPAVLYMAQLPKT